MIRLELKVTLSIFLRCRTLNKKILVLFSNIRRNKIIMFYSILFRIPLNHSKLMIFIFSQTTYHYLWLADLLVSQNVPPNLICWPFRFIFTVSHWAIPIFYKFINQKKGSQNSIKFSLLYLEFIEIFTLLWIRVS